ncbi:ABC transporter ATP-binding protein [Caldalkalibacillus salinus]|uniref:ABC transporter ATP-binding protein n=1 Tax=Caldalkalibacillus salinus TaxID=2803787 RepID=UPI001922C131|nr:ABC transporter ATP-binding protein [Caldalkalibacillus salinus]
MLTCNIRKELRDFELDIEFTIGKETLVIVGHSGCGKSTTLRAIAGLIRPDQGEITIGDQFLFSHDKKINMIPEEREIGFLFQNYALFPHLTVYENVGFGLAARHIPPAEQKKRVEEQLALVGMTEYIDNMPDELSGGQQQRVALARALVLEPKILLLDEPLSALDVTTRDRVRRELKKTLSLLNIPAVVVTHDYEDAISLGQRILVMDEGKIIQEGTSQELIQAPRSSFVADFSGTNYFDGRMTKQEDGLAHFKLERWGETLRSTARSEGEQSIVIQPWDIRLTKEKPSASRANVLASKVINILMYGNRLRVDLEGPIPLVVEVQGEDITALMGMEEGDDVYAVIEPEAVKVLEKSTPVRKSS